MLLFLSLIDENPRNLILIVHVLLLRLISIYKQTLRHIVSQIRDVLQPMSLQSMNFLHFTVS